MNLGDKFRYDGKRVLVVGGATGMGAAGAELALALGAQVVVMDYAEIALAQVAKVKLNLAEKASIDAAVAEAQGPFDAVFSCAGVADGTPGIERINFVGHRYLLEQLVAKGKLGRRGAATGYPHQCHLSGANRHATGAGQPRAMARQRRRFSRRSGG